VGVLYCSTRTIARWKRRVEEEGVQAALGTPPTSSRLGSWWSEKETSPLEYQAPLAPTDPLR